MSWEEVWSKFILLKSARSHPKTLRNYEKAKKKFEEFWNEVHPEEQLPEPNAITVEQIAMYVLWLKRKYQANYVEKMFSILLQVLKFSGNSQTYQIEQYRPKRERKPREYYTLEELRTLLRLYDESSFSNFMLKTMIHTIALTGMRFFEVLNLSWSRVNLKEKVIRIKGKGGRWRLVLITGPLQDILQRYRKAWDGYKAFCEGMGWSIPGEDSLFFRIDENGRPWPGTDRVFYNRIRRKAKKVGIKFNFKKFRSTLAKITHSQGYTTDVAAILLGHSDIKTTADFYHELEVENVRPLAENIAQYIIGGDEDESRK